jgi:hypothetical protein
VKGLSGTDLAFAAETHEYRLSTGARVPSVTEILRATGISFDYDLIGNGAARDALAYRRALGTAVHADAHAYDDGELRWDTVDAAVKPYLDAWVLFRANSQLTPIVRERRLYHGTWGYAGTMDGVFEHAVSGRLVLLDIKTGDPEQSACRFQTAAYLAAYMLEQEDRRVMDRMAVQLCPELAIPYRITHYPHPFQNRDFRKFTCFVTTYNEQYGRRLL